MRQTVLAAISICFMAVALRAQDASPVRFFVKLRENAALSWQYGRGNAFPSSFESISRQHQVSGIRGLIPPREGLMKQASSGLEQFVLVTVDNPSAISGAMEAFAGLPEVEYVEPERIYRLDFVPDDSAYASQWGMKRIGMEKAWDVTQGSSNIFVGIIDTGIDYYHDDLKTQLWINTREDINGNGRFDPWPSSETREGTTGDFDGADNDGNGYIDDVIGYDFVNQPSVANTGGGDYRDPDADPLDEQGHGSSVSGIIAAATNNGEGIAGIAPGVRLVTLRAFDARGVGTEGDVAQAIAYAVTNSVSILNMSFGDVTYSRVLRDIVRYAYGRGIVMVASAGNSQSDALHYPSAYDETISVSSTMDNDALAGFSNYGTTIDIAAPGQDIVTTDKQNRYTSFNGTSASAPFVTGVAALVRSLHPELTPEEVRGILLASAQDLGQKGWDSRFGAGILDAAKAVSQQFPSEVKILSPKTDYSLKGGTFPVVATAVSPLMTGYRLDIGTGDNPSKWTPLVEFTRLQVIAETLFVFNAAEYLDTTYTLRLAALSDKGTTLEDRVVIHIDRTPPVFKGVGFIPCIDGNNYGVALGYITDEPTLGKVWYRSKNSGRPWQWKAIESASENNLFIAAQHYCFLGFPDLFPGNTYEFYLSAENQVGDISIANNQGANFEMKVPLPVPETGYRRKAYNLPAGRVSGLISDFNANGVPEMLFNESSNGTPFKAMEYDGQTFRNIASSDLGGRLPRAVGDANGDGAADLLTSMVRKAFLFNSDSPNTVPETLAWADTTSPSFWPAAIADVNGDGKNEMLAVINDTAFGVYTFDESYGLTRTGTLPNGSPASGFGPNTFNSPTVAVGDFNGNGKTDILIGDNDADFMIFESRGGGDFALIKGIANDYETGGEFVTSGDFDGDGRKEFTLGFRTSNEDVIPFWYFGIFRLDEQNTLHELWSERFYGVETGTLYGLFTKVSNNVVAGNADDDPADELIISVYPELYIIDYDSKTKQFQPSWHYPLANSNSTALADFDGNGVPDIAFAGIDSVRFFEKDVPYNGPVPPRFLSALYSAPLQIVLSWNADTPPPHYRVYTSQEGGAPALTHTLDANTNVSINVLPGRTYKFYVCAYDPAKTPQESPRLATRLFTTHSQPSIDSVSYLQLNQVRVHVTQDMGNEIPSTDLFSLTDRLGQRHPLSVVLADQRSIILTFERVADGNASISSSGLRDGEGVPFPDGQEVSFVVANIKDNEFYITRVEYMGGQRFCVYFNIPVQSASASNPLNYRIEPVGVAFSAVVDPSDPRKVCISLEGALPIGALGKEYVLKVRNLISAGGVPIAEGAGSTAGIILNRDNLDDVFVYPNPWSPSDGQDFITFANLTQEATIRVYTLSGVFINQVKETDGNGGVEWNMLDEHGGKIPPGVYIYYVTGKNGAGVEDEAKTGKFAVVR